MEVEFNDNSEKQFRLFCKCSYLIDQFFFLYFFIINQNNILNREITRGDTVNQNGLMNKVLK